MSHPPALPALPSAPFARPQRAYLPSPYGQLHYRMCSPQDGVASAPTLVCLHATAYSSRSFEAFMPFAAQGRQVLALDTPGYGESDGPVQAGSMPAYAQAIDEALDALAPTSAVDLLGYHTGALLALELALRQPQRVRRLVLIGVPFFPDPREHAVWRARLLQPAALGEDLYQFRERWDYFVTHRAAGLPLERAFANFVDELKAYPNEWFTHHALFEHDTATRLPLVRQATLVLNPTSALAQPSRDAAALMPHAQVVEEPALAGPIFDLHPALVATHVRRFLG